jgi:beta-galactosidase
MLPIGVTFYPDQWPKSYWEKAFSEIAKSGFRIVRFGEMAWNWIEPSNGKFNFADLDAALDMAHKFGLRILLGLPTSQAPMWFIKKHPEIRPLAEDKTPYPEYGPRPNLCRDSKTYRKYAKRLIEKIVIRYKDHPAIFMWQLDNEPVVAPLDSTTNKDFCHCKASEAAFREWAKKEYKDIKTLNEKWGTKFWTVEFSNFSEILPPRCGMWDAGNPHIFLDWFRFKSLQLRDFLGWGKALVKKIDPNHKVGTNGFIGICSRVPDHDVLSETMDWYGLDVYPRGNRASSMDVARLLDTWRSFTIDKNCEYHVTEMQGGQNVRWGYPGHVKGCDIRLWTHQAFAHGAKTLLYHAWRTPLFGSETGGFGILKLDGSESDRLASIQQSIREINRVSNILENSHAAASIAIAHLRGSEVESYQEQGPSRGVSGQWMDVRSDIGLMHGLFSSAGAHKTVWNYFNPVSFIFDKQIESSSGLSFTAVLLPNPYILTDRAAKCLTKYVYDGGVLITEARFGLKDENGHLYEFPLMEKLLDVKYDHTEIIDDKLEVSELGVKVSGFRDVVKALGNGVMAKFNDGSPALIEKKIGKGRIIYAAFSLYLSAMNDETGKLAELIRKYIPAPEFTIENADSVEMVHLVGNRNILYLINHSDKKASPTLKFPSSLKEATDALTDKLYMAVNGSIRVDMAGEEVKVLVLE